MDRKYTNNLTEKKAQNYKQLSKGIKTVLQQTYKRYSTPLIREMQTTSAVNHLFIFQERQRSKRSRSGEWNPIHLFPKERNVAIAINFLN